MPRTTTVDARLLKKKKGLLRLAQLDIEMMVFTAPHVSSQSLKLLQLQACADQMNERSTEWPGTHSPQPFVRGPQQQTILWQSALAKFGKPNSWLCLRKLPSWWKLTAVGLSCRKQPVLFLLPPLPILRQQEDFTAAGVSVG